MTYRLCDVIMTSEFVYIALLLTKGSSICAPT